jgi:hypothetical protein
MFASFLYPFFQRVLSGYQSRYGYEKSKIGLIIGSIIMCLFPLSIFQSWWLFFLFMIVNVFVVYMKTMSFNLIPQLTFLSKYRDIHLWENLLTGGYFLFTILAGYNIIMVLASVYPALIIHKGLINLGSGLSFFATATDDPTGKTYGFRLSNLKIKRSSNVTRLILAIGSLIVAFLTVWFNWSITL